MVDGHRHADGLAGDAALRIQFAVGFACVLLFSQEKTTRAEGDMRRMTEALIDAALDHGGSYYLPYRPHATRQQLLRAYPRVRDFVALKRAHDPALKFRNRFWSTYLEDLA